MTNTTYERKILFKFVVPFSQSQRQCSGHMWNEQEAERSHLEFQA